jgi:NAD(P)-dependent dehydrogenase (short-subunit alcohol dehydrogenase family)
VTKRFAGRTAIVTGASRGIGLAIAERLVADGAHVVVTARNQESLTEAVAGLGERALGIAGRADDGAHQDDVIARTLHEFGRLDFLVNNAGINPTYGPIMGLNLDAARKTFEVNCLAALSWVQKVYAARMRGHGGAIVNVSSLSSIRTAHNIGFYGATKAMLNSLTDLMAVELGPAIRVNGVAPGVVKTKFAAALYEGKEDRLSRGYPLKRLGEPHDIGGVVAFLLSDDAAWITGQTLVVDGGLSLATGEE